MNIDDLKAKHEVDQAIAESVELGNVRIVGQNEQRQDLMQLTSKGVTRTALLFCELTIQQADAEKRDFTEAERHKLVAYLLQAITALQKAIEEE